jgi:hypothetical protein
MENKFIQWQIKDGQPVLVGEQKVTPQTQVLTLRFPFGGFVWNRPVAVLVEENGRSQRLPIPDVTRMILLAVAVVSTAVVIMAQLQSSKVAE